jgi:hypothetical protein
VVRAYLDDPGPHLDAMRDRGQPADHPIDLVRSAFSHWGHHKGYVYDWPALCAELDRAGFVNVQRCALGESVDPVLCDLDRLPSLADFYLSVEATKP